MVTAVAQITAVAWVQFLGQEPLHAMDVLYPYPPKKRTFFCSLVLLVPFLYHSCSCSKAALHV